MLTAASAGNLPGADHSSVSAERELILTAQPDISLRIGRKTIDTLLLVVVVIERYRVEEGFLCCDEVQTGAVTSYPDIPELVLIQGTRIGG